MTAPSVYPNCPRCCVERAERVELVREYLDAPGGERYTALVCPRCGYELPD